MTTHIVSNLDDRTVTLTLDNDTADLVRYALAKFAEDNLDTPAITVGDHQVLNRVAAALYDKLNQFLGFELD